MKSLIIFFSLLLLLLSCKKEKEDKTPIKEIPAESKERMINDSTAYINWISSTPIDIDGDGIDDVALYINSSQVQTTQFDSTLIKPLHSGIQIAQKKSTFYTSKISTKCPIGTDTVVFSTTKMCEENAPNVYLSEEINYAITLKEYDSSIQFSALNGSLLIGYFYSSYTNTPCGQFSNSTYYGKYFGENGLLFFIIKDKKYALKVSEKVPYLYIHSVTLLD